MTDTDAVPTVAPLALHVVSHTHWDREWYLPAARFRQRLVPLVDELLDDPPADGAAFLLDGQAILLEDYLAVRPERQPRLARLLGEGRLEAGPWYVLPDELIPSFEALVRNLLAGARVLRDLDAAAPPVLYCPDSFGHPAALPSLAAGFGFPLIIAWRGYGGRRWPAGDTVRWRGVDGHRVLLHHLPPDGYETGANLPTEPTAAAERWRALHAVLRPRAVLGVALLPNGADHHARQAHLDEALAALRQVADDADIRQSTLRAFAADVVDRAASRPLPEICGELRDSHGYAWTLGGTLATRAAQKRHNATVERLLVRDAEPWATLARRSGHARFGPLVRSAWRTLLHVHPHDTLCGCSTDEVARAADARLDSAHAEAAGIREDALAALIGHDPAHARERSSAWRPVLVVRNAVARRRGGVAQVEIIVKLGDLPVGPGSAARAEATGRRTHPDLRLSDPNVRIQVLERGERVDRVDSPRHYPDADLVDCRDALAWIEPIAGYGTRSWEVVSGTAAAAPGMPAVRAEGLTLTNAHLRVSADEQGRISVESGSERWSDVLGFEHQADLGDLYTPSLRDQPVVEARLRRQRLLHRGPLRAAIEQAWTMRVPASGSARRLVDLPLTTVVAVDAGLPVMRVHVRGLNVARDHRLRIHFRTGLPGARVIADAALGPMVRTPLEVHPDDARMERPLPTAPLHRWVALDGASTSMALISDGLAEYEATSAGTLAVTLLRAVGELARADLSERPGRAGWPTSTPEAQCPGPFEANFGLMPCGPFNDETLMAIERAAEDLLVPLCGHTIRSALRLPDGTDGVELHGEGLVCAAVLDSADEAWTVLRCVNVLDRATGGTWRLGFTVTEARTARLDETPGTPLDVAGNAVHFHAGPRAVVTILVR